MESLNTGNKNVQRRTAFYLSFTVLSLKEKLVYLEGSVINRTNRPIIRWKIIYLSFRNIQTLTLNLSFKIQDRTAYYRQIETKIEDFGMLL